MYCIPCAAGFEDECLYPILDDSGFIESPCRNNSASDMVSGDSNLALAGKLEAVNERAERSPKDDSLLRDVKSTGRKRAAKAAPLSEGMACEWQRLKFAGGGVKPIMGCREGIAQARHHGPDKDTLNNQVGLNLHRICHVCHNRWHARNDGFYGTRTEPGVPFIPLAPHPMLPHDSETQWELEEWFEEEMHWSSNPPKKATEE